MKRWISFLCHLALFGALTSFVGFSSTEKSIVVPNSLKVKASSPFIHPQLNPDYGDLTSNLVYLGNSYLGFRESLAFKESQGDYEVTNTLGYLGKYQFGANTLKLMGVHNVTDFMSNPILQEKVFELNVARNKWILRRDIKRFVGKRINGTVITESGIVAAAHLAGAGNVKKYLRSYGKTDFSDAYGSNIRYYMHKFGGFDISKVKAERNPKV